MAKQTMPSVTISFYEQAIASIARSDKGTVALILEDTGKTGGFSMTSVTGIPAELGEENQAYIERAFTGYINPPKKVICYSIGEDGTLTAALEWLATQSFDYLAGMPDISSDDADTIASWIKSQRTNNHAIYKAVLPNVAADNEGIVNFTTEWVTDGTTTWTTAQYCSRIAGLLAGTPMKISATYAPLSELSGCAYLDAEARDEAIGKGEFIVWYDGEKVKTGRAVNSFVTTIDDKGASFQKIKIVEAMDMIQHDIRQTAEDSYIGKYANSYDNRILLITAVKGYLLTMQQDDIVQEGYTVEHDLDAIEAYLQGKGTDTEDMTEDDLKRADTGSNVYLRIDTKILDAIEDIQVKIYI